MDQSSKRVLRKVARISGTLLAAIILFLTIAEAMESWGKPGPGLGTYNIILFMFSGVGTAGLILALWKECWGGLVSLTDFLVFNILAALNPTTGSRYFSFLLLSLVPSILYLSWCWLEKNSKNKTPGS